MASFWQILSDRGQTDGPVADKAWRAFAAAAVSPDHVADRIALDLIAESTPSASLWGMGRNGRLLAARLLSQGISVRGRDDRWPDGRAPDHELSVLPGAGLGVSFIPEPLDSPLEPGTGLIITPESDTDLVQHLRAVGEPVGFRRWTGVADQLAVEIGTDLASALHETRAERSIRA